MSTIRDTRIYPHYRTAIAAARDQLRTIEFVSGDGPFNDAVRRVRAAVADVENLIALRDRQAREAVEKRREL